MGNGKKQPFFSPDSIANSISQALNRDFSSSPQVYPGDEGVRNYFCTRQKGDLLKKYRPESIDSDTLKANAFDKFIGLNQHMAETNERLRKELPSRPLTTLSFSRDMDEMDVIHHRARALVHMVLGRLDEDSWFRRCKNSGGTSLGVSYNDTSNEAKFTFPISCTQRAYRMFRRCMARNGKLWSEIESFNTQYPVKDCFDFVIGSRATTVDKTAEVDRFIGIEPSANMYLQQGLMLEMYELMASVGLDVRSLPLTHKQLAWISSMTLRDATVDWASASDCNAIELVRWLFPPCWFSAIDQVRCSVITLDGVPHNTNMISSMGNAGTFPIETLIFWAYAHAVLKASTDNNGLTPNWDDINRCSVFGDDCIVPTSHASKYIDVMTKCGFIINKEKSYYGDEQFRESCGGDYLKGRDVRPFCLKAPTDTRKSALEPWLYIIANGLIPKYRLYFGDLGYIYDKELFKELARLFSQYNIKVRVVPDDFPDDAGLKISNDLSRFHLNYDFTWNDIKRSHHGTYTFSYCRFMYWHREIEWDGIHYQLWLKNPKHDERDPTHDYMIRERGGYVVAKGISCHWHVPQLRLKA